MQGDLVSLGIKAAERGRRASKQSSARSGEGGRPAPRSHHAKQQLMTRQTKDVILCALHSMGAIAWVTGKLILDVS